MKTRRFFLLIIVSISFIALFACTDNSQSNTYLISYSYSTGGSVQGEVLQYVGEGESGSEVVAVADSGYLFLEWSDGSREERRTEQSVCEDKTLTAYFVVGFEVEYCAGEGGSVSVEGKQLVALGSIIEVEATADTGYLFSHWSDGGTNPAREDNISAALNLTAIFVKQRFTVEYQTDGNGYIDNYSTQDVPYGESGKTITAIANTGYKFSHWSDNNINPTRTDAPITSSKTVRAIFVRESYALTYDTDGNGTIAGDEEQSILYQQSGEQVTAVPNEGYKFSHWSDGVTTATRQESMIDEAKTLTAYFVRVYKVQYLADVGGEVVGLTSQEVEEGASSQAVCISLNDGYMFTQWSDGSGWDIRQDHSINQDITVTAQFEFLFADGDGSEENPLQINSYGQLLMINLFPHSNYKLIADLDLQGINHIPMFNWGYMFHGTFNGDNHTISNLTVSRYLALPSLFGGITADGTVKNLIIANFSITVHNYNTTLIINGETTFTPLCAGAVAGVSYGLLENINVSGEIAGEQFGYNGVSIGGIVGLQEGETTNCHSALEIELSGVNVTGSDYPFNVGGICGIARDSIYNCSSSGIITIDFTEDGESGRIGGLVGVFKNTTESEIKIVNCFSTIIIVLSFSATSGGLVGEAHFSSSFMILNCYATGDIDIEKYSENDFSSVGGFCGAITSTSNGFIENCYATGNVSKAYFVAGFVGSLSVFSDKDSIAISDCFATGNVNGINAAGFISDGWRVNVFRSYASGDVIGTEGAAGFANDITGENIEACFSTGSVYGFAIDRRSGCWLAGFIGAASPPHRYRLSIKNCYSLSNIYINQLSTYSFNASGFMVLVANADISNCHYAGKIVLVEGTWVELYGFIQMVGLSSIDNCYWVYNIVGLDTVIEPIELEYSKSSNIEITIIY